VSAVNVAEMTATIEQGLSNLEAAIALIPPAVDAPPAERHRTGRATKRRIPASKGREVGRQLDATAQRCRSLRR
jgi:hypothetical protein